MVMRGCCTYGRFLNKRRGGGIQALHQAPKLLQGTDHDVLAGCNVCCPRFVFTARIIHYCFWKHKTRHLMGETNRATCLALRGLYSLSSDGQLGHLSNCPLVCFLSSHVSCLLVIWRVFFPPSACVLRIIFCPLWTCSMCKTLGKETRRYPNIVT